MYRTVVAILEDYWKWENIKIEKSYNKLSWKEKDELRLQNDNDAKFFYEQNSSKDDALCADTIISFWTPYRRLLELEAHWNSSKTEKSLKALLYQLTTDRVTNYSENIKSVSEKIEPFAKVCYTKGNYMLLPNRKMNPQRYSIAEDRIDMTIYECFEKGALSKFFKQHNELIAWIETQKLSLIFNGSIEKDNIKWFVEEEKPKWISEMNEKEIYQYLNSAVDLITQRNCFYSPILTTLQQ